MSPEDTREDLPVVRVPKMDPRLRRVLEAGALGLLSVALLQVHWWDDTRQVSKHMDSPEITTVVTGQGKLGHVQWWLQGLSARGGSLKFDLVAQPLDEQGVKELNGTRYQVRGSSVWSANGFARDVKAGQPSRVTVSATVPEARAAEVALELRLPVMPGQKGQPRPVLRFAR